MGRLTAPSMLAVVLLAIPSLQSTGTSVGDGARGVRNAVDLSSFFKGATAAVMSNDVSLRENAMNAREQQVPAETREKGVREKPRLNESSEEIAGTRDRDPKHRAGGMQHGREVAESAGGPEESSQAALFPNR